MIPFPIHAARVAAFVTVMTLVPVATATAQDVELRKSGTIDISQLNVAFMFGGSLGGGTLHYGGKSYDFTVGGAGLGGFGGSRLEATGTVYNLDRLADFAGAYGQVRKGFAAGSEGSAQLWLENGAGVYIELVGTREGAMLAMGGDVLYIDLDN